MVKRLRRAIAILAVARKNASASSRDENKPFAPTFVAKKK